MLLTRATESGDATADRLRGLGAEVAEKPLIRIGPPPDEAALAAAAARTDFDWIAFASVHGVEAYARRRALQRMGSEKFAAVGPATSRAIHAAFGRPADLVPASHTGGDMGAALAAVMAPGERALLVQALDARPDALEALAGAGRSVEAVAAYATLEEPPSGLLHIVRDAHAVVIASGSAARSLRSGLGAQTASALSGKSVVCIGPVTAAEARHAGIPVTLVPRTYSMSGVIDVLLEHYAPR